MLDLIYLLSIVAAAFALYYKVRYARGLKRLAALLEQQRLAGNEKAEAPVESKAGGREDG